MSNIATAEHHLEHLAQVGDLLARQRKPYPPAVRTEAAAQLLRFTDRGLALQKFGKEQPMTKKHRADSAPQPTTFTGQGILFAVIDNREEMQRGATTIDTIADAIEAALDAGHETSEEIARYITTSAFQHIPDKRIRYNSVLQANDSVGGFVTRKLLNAYNELAQLAEEETDIKKKAEITSEARGFAEAIQVVLSPFSCEDPEDPRLVNWDEVDRITDAFIKEQRFVRKERKGNPQ